MPAAVMSCRWSWLLRGTEERRLLLVLVGLLLLLVLASLQMYCCH